MTPKLPLFFLLFLAMQTPGFSAEKPNIIFILCDDLGWGDLGVFHQNDRESDHKNVTPHLNQFAAEGIQLRAHYCPAPVCAPSRASLLTGLHQGHATIRDSQFDKALPDDFTLASTLKAVGYRTALIGKYGLQGDGETAAEWPAYPTKRGFDEFLGYVRHRDGHLHYPAHTWEIGNSEGHQEKKEVWHNDEEISAQLTKCFTSDLFTAYAKKWITAEVQGTPDEPFFLYLAFDTPHAALQFPPCAYPEGGGLDGGAQWLGKEGEMINTAKGEVDGWVHPDHKDWPEGEARQAGMIRRIDEHIADLTQLLRDLEVDENTLVVFSSDNGPHSETYYKGGDYSPDLAQAYGPFDGIKRDTLEGGIRVPSLAWWPGKIPAGRIVEEPAQFHDWLNTFLAAANAPLQAQSDGVSLLPLLTGERDQETPTTYIEYFNKGKTPGYEDFAPEHRGKPRGQMQVLFLDGYKGLRLDIEDPEQDFQIFDVREDPSEINNLAETEGEKFRDLQQRMKDTVLQIRRPNESAPRPYDALPIPSIEDLETSEGVSVRFLAGDFAWVPVIPQEAEDSQKLQVEGFDFDVPGKGSVEVSGYLKVSQTGPYIFSLDAPDAAVLHVHKALVIDGDTPGKDGGTIQTTATLAEGLHPFRLGYLSDGKNAILKVAGPGSVEFVK